MKITQEELEKLIKDAVEKSAPSVDMKVVGTLIDTKLSEAVKVEEKKVVASKEESEDNPWSCFAEFASKVATAGKSHGLKVDSRLIADAELKATDLSEGDSEYGGYLVPVEYRKQLLKLAIEKSEILSKCVKVPMLTNAIQFPYLSGFDHSGGVIHGGVEFEWLDEGAQKSQKDVKFGKIELRLKKLAAFVKATDEILEDSWVSMEPLLKNAFTDGLAYQLDNVFINGDGAGKPMGFLNSACLVTITKETGQADATILYSLEASYGNVCRTNSVNSGETLANYGRAILN